MKKLVIILILLLSISVGYGNTKQDTTTCKKELVYNNRIKWVEENINNDIQWDVDYFREHLGDYEYIQFMLVSSLSPVVISVYYKEIDITIFHCGEKITWVHGKAKTFYK